MNCRKDSTKSSRKNETTTIRDAQWSGSLLSTGRAGLSSGCRKLECEIPMGGDRMFSVSPQNELNNHPLHETNMQTWIDQNHGYIGEQYKTTQQLMEGMQRFQLDDPDASLTFSKRLARESGWSHTYALRVIQEYKRFIVLCCIVPGGATPSDAVDQAWHLHMLYTRSYWDDMCGDVIGRSLHHGPTKGGGKEGKRFDGMYTRTKEAYSKLFREEPPEDIWPTNDVRFSDIDFQRVNKRTHFIIPKPSALWGKLVGAMAAIALVMLNVQAMGLSTNAWLVIGLIALVIILIIIFRRRNGGGRGGGGGGCGGDTSWIPFVSSGCSSSSSSSHSSSGCGSSGCSSSGCSSSCGGGCSGCGS